MKYPRGTLIGFEAGEYSDFRFNGMLVSLADIDLRKLAAEYVEHRRQMKALGSLGEWESANDFCEFLGWLVANQHCAPINYSTVFLGYYDEFDSEFAISSQDDE